MKNFKQITDNRYNEYPINDDLEITRYVGAIRTVINCPQGHASTAEWRGINNIYDQNVKLSYVHFQFTCSRIEHLVKWIGLSDLTL